MAPISPASQSTEVAIVGGGVAASATALALSAAGIRARLLVRPSREVRMAEAIPASAMQLFRALDLSDVALQVAIVSRGLDNRGDPIVEELAASPALRRNGPDVTVTVDGQRRHFDVAIDASGRAAIWSRPVKRVRHLIADIFAVPCAVPSAALTLTRFGDGWAYRISRPNDATVAILAAPGRRHNTFPAQLATDLELPATGLRRVGRRAAFVQWATRVAAERVLAVGDAALAHDPVSGQGIRFALASALAVAAVIRTWRRARDDEALATRFYDEFVATERKRHGAFCKRYTARNLISGRFSIRRRARKSPARCRHRPCRCPRRSASPRRWKRSPCTSADLSNGAMRRPRARAPHRFFHSVEAPPG